MVFDDPTRPSGRSEFAVDGEYLYFTIAEQQKDVFTIEFDFGSGS